MRTAEELEREERFTQTRSKWFERFPSINDATRTEAEHVPAPDEGITAKQWRRWSALTLRGVMAVPPASLRPFDVAMRLGKVAKQDGSFTWIKALGQAVYVQLSPVQRDKVLRLLGINDRQWRRHVSAWEACSMAHRCADLARGHVRLFFAPETKCPACEQILSGHEVTA